MSKAVGFDKAFGKLKPPTDLGFWTEFGAGTNCDGECTAKDWSAIVEKQGKGFGEGKILKDEKGPGKRTIINELTSGDTYVLVAWWKDKVQAHQGVTMSW